MLWPRSRSLQDSGLRRVSRGRSALLLGVGVAGFLVVPLVTSAMGMNWPSVFRECTAAAHRIQVLVFGRTFATWVGWNLWDFVLFLGPPLTLV